jgi:hypothetical protein
MAGPDVMRPPFLQSRKVSIIVARSMLHVSGVTDTEKQL